MKIVTAPMTFQTGKALDPADLNALFFYMKDALADVASKRLQRSVLPIQFVEAMGTPYTQATALETRTQRFICPNTCIVERAMLFAQLTCSGGPVTVTIEDTGGSTPAGATTPWLTTKDAVVTEGDSQSLSSDGIVSSAASEVFAINNNRVLLVAGTEYLIKVTGSTFTLNRFDLSLHLATDRFVPAGTDLKPTFAPDLLGDADTRDADGVTADKAEVEAAAAVLAARYSAPSPVLFVAHGFLSTTDADLLRFELPSFCTDRAAAKTLRAYLFVDMAGTGGTTVTATLLDWNGVTISTLTANVAGVQQASASASINNTLTQIEADASTSQARDLRVVFANASAGTTCRKATLLLWVDRPS